MTGNTRANFFAAVRSSLFGGKLDQHQVDGMNAALDACDRFGVTDPHHVAHGLAEIRHETGGYMLPIKETVMAWHEDKNPSDAEVIGRLDRAFASGKLPWVKKPYWRDGWFGRGPVQTTHKANYERIGKAIGVDLVANRDLILRADIGAAAAIVGMRDGIYTGRKLSDYRFPGALDADWKHHPRRIINGRDGTDAEVSGYHRAFHKALLV